MAKNKLFVLNRSGHAPVAEWNPTNLAQIKTAEETFGDLQTKGFHFFDATDPQDTKTEITKFNPEAKEIVAFGALEGG